MDVRRVTSGAGAVAALLAAMVLPAPAVVVPAGVVGALTVPLVDREAVGLAGASLAVVAAGSLAALAAADADVPRAAVVSLFVVAGVAGCAGAAIREFAASSSRRPEAVGQFGGRVAGLLGAWAALVLTATAALAVASASSQPLRSLLGARLAIPGASLLMVAVPVTVAGVAGWSALGAWRRAGLPPLLFVAAPAGLFAGWAVVAAPTPPKFRALLWGSVADAPYAYVLVWATATVVVATALAAGVAAEDPRFRRGQAWIAVALGPIALGAMTSIGGGGTFVAAARATVPPVAEAFGAVVETSDPSTAASVLVGIAASALAFAAMLPARAPLLRDLTTGRPAGVGAGCLLVAVTLSRMEAWTTIVGGGLVVLSWILLAAEFDIAPRPQTAFARAGLATLAVGLGGVLAVSLVDLAPRTDPGVGGVVLLVGVAVLGLAIR